MKRLSRTIEDGRRDNGNVWIDCAGHPLHNMKRTASIPSEQLAPLTNLDMLDVLKISSQSFTLMSCLPSMSSIELQK